MGVWKSIENLSVGDQESMAGRAEIQLEVVRKFIVSNFSKYQIQKMRKIQMKKRKRKNIKFTEKTITFIFIQK